MKFDTPDVMGILRRIGNDLRNQRLWPLAVLLLVAIVGVPIVLSKSSSATPVAQVPQTGASAPQANGIPALNVQSTPVQSKLTGRSRNPFQQQGGSTSTTSATSSATATSSSTSTAAANTGTSGGAATSPSTGSSSTTSAPTANSTPPKTTIPAGASKPAPPGLKPTQSYVVSVGITNSSGGFNTIDPLERLSVLPSAQQPQLIELGVLQGGHSVLFAVQPGTVLNGPGACTPGPIDCEILSLGENKTEGISTQSSSGTTLVADFAITSITTQNYSSAGAADKARQAASATGRDLLNQSTLSALSLFQYSPSVGAVVDERNLTVGGNS